MEIDVEMLFTCVTSPTNKMQILERNPRLEEPLPQYYFCTTLRSSALSPATPVDPTTHHPAMDSSVLSLQCGKGTAYFRAL